MSSLITSIRTHILGIVAFLALPYLFTPPHPPNVGNHLQDFLILKKMSTNALLILFFYVNYYVLIPRYFFTKRYGFFLALLLPPGIVITFLAETLAPPAAAFGPIPLLLRIETNVVLFCATVFVSLALKINNRWQESEKQKLDAELSFLKAQINPHFLFNTLNSIYTLAVKKSELTAPAIIKLSGMMRYVITEAQAEYVSLEKELLYVSNFIALQHIRLGSTVALNFETDIPSNTEQIAPLILIPFVENAFKYGINPEETSPIRIDLILEEHRLRLTTQNRIFRFPHDKSSTDTPSGLGIINARKRLDLIYPGRYSLEIIRTDDNFTVRLIIDL